MGILCVTEPERFNLVPVVLGCVMKINVLKIFTRYPGTYIFVVDTIYVSHWKYNRFALKRLLPKVVFAPECRSWKLCNTFTWWLGDQRYFNTPHKHLTSATWYRINLTDDDVIKWKHFPRYWSFVRGIHRSPVNSPHKGQWLGALMFSLICAGVNGWVNNGEASDLRRNRAHYDVTVMVSFNKNSSISNGSQSHYNDVTRTSGRMKSPTPRLFVHQHVRSNSK